MEVKSCKRCKRLFNYLTGDIICPACKEEIEKSFQDVKQYIQNHQHATVMEVAKECDVSEKQIRQWVREERLEMSSATAEFVCENCGTPINSGRYCPKCKAELANSLTNALNKDKPKVENKHVKVDNKNRMRFL